MADVNENATKRNRFWETYSDGISIRFIRGVSIGVRTGCRHTSTTPPRRIRKKPVEKTSLFRTFFSRPKRMIALMIPRVIRGIRRFPISTIVLVTPYSSVESTRVYNGIRRKTRTFELKVPTANISVLETSFLYLSKAKPRFHLSFAAKTSGSGNTSL